jgi:hypothetical protein
MQASRVADIDGGGDGPQALGIAEMRSRVCVPGASWDLQAGFPGFAEVLPAARRGPAVLAGHYQYNAAFIMTVRCPAEAESCFTLRHGLKRLG